MKVHPQSVAIVAAARSCIGTRFRVQGRLPGVGLDCIGVALVGAAAAGRSITPPAYTLGGDHEARLDAVLASLGCTSIGGGEIGDLIVFAPGAGRRHLAIAVPAGIVHAHAGLRRVVEGPIDPAWPRVACWRFPEE